MGLLPTLKTKGKLTIETATWTVYGAPGIGKSTFAAGFPDPLFLATELTQKHLSLHLVPIDSWEKFLKVAKELQDNGDRFHTVVVDTTDLLYKMCQEYCCAKFGFDHPSDEGYGKGYDKVNSEFYRGVLMLKHLGKAVIFIAHYTEREDKVRGVTYKKTVPSLPGGCWKIVSRESDVIALCDFDPKRPDFRIFRYTPEIEIEAKDRGGVFPEGKLLALDYKAMSEAWGTGPGPRTPGKALGGPKRAVRKGVVRKGGTGPTRKGPKRKS